MKIDLNYKNDPWLLDKETVNDLISEGKEDKIFLDKEKKYLNLFTAYIKRKDFDEQGKIVEWIEYYNPIISARAFGLIDKIK